MNISLTYTHARIIAFGLALFVYSCEKNPLGTIDPATVVPNVTNAAATPDSVYIDALTPTNDLYTVNLTLSVRSIVSGSGQVVLATILKPDGRTTGSEVSLRDDGVSPDATPGDNIYSGAARLELRRSDAGAYRIRFTSRSADGALGNVIEKTVKITRRNAAPQLLNVSSPDSVDLPVSGYITVQFTAAVADSDGLADIREVFFQRIAPDPNPTKFFLKDDGGAGRNTFAGFPDTLLTGDAVAGDGNYSILLPVTPTNTRGTRTFAFRAIDSFGDTSQSIQRTFTIR